jgi:putative transposase
MRVSREELQRVKSAMNNEKEARYFKRYQSLYLYLSGKKCDEVASIVGLSKISVSRINQVYKKEGLAGIPDKPREGRPRRLTQQQETKIRELILNNVPSEVGFPAEFNWTAGLVAKYIKREYSLDYTIRGITGILDRLGLSYTRPTYVLAKADKEKQALFVKDFEKLKKTCWTVKSNTSFSATNQ